MEEKIDEVAALMKLIIALQIQVDALENRIAYLEVGGQPWKL